jgi:hypothetical protein
MNKAQPRVLGVLGLGITKTYTSGCCLCQIRYGEDRFSQFMDAGVCLSKPSRGRLIKRDTDRGTGFLIDKATLHAMKSVGIGCNWFRNDEVEKTQFMHGFNSIRL